MICAPGALDVLVIRLAIIVSLLSMMSRKVREESGRTSESARSPERARFRRVPDLGGATRMPSRNRGKPSRRISDLSPRRAGARPSERDGQIDPCGKTYILWRHGQDLARVWRSPESTRPMLET